MFASQRSISVQQLQYLPVPAFLSPELLVVWTSRQQPRTEQFPAVATMNERIYTMIEIVNLCVLGSLDPNET